MAFINEFSKVREFFELRDSLPGDYPVLEQLRPFIKSAIETYLQFKLERVEDRVENYYVYNSNLYFFEYNPVVSISSLKKISKSGEERVLSDSEYQHRTWGVEIIDTPFQRNDRIEVVYTGGYEVQTVDSEEVISCPIAIKNAALYQLQHEWKNRHMLGGGQEITQVGTLSIDPVELIPKVEELLADIRSPKRYVVI